MNACQHCLTTSMRGKLVKMLIISLEPHDIHPIFESNSHNYLFLHCPVTGMQNGAEAAGRI